MYKTQIDAYFDDPAVQNQMVSAVGRLVNIRSVREEALPGMPFGAGPAKALAEGLDLCRELGFSAENADGYVGTADLNALETQLHILGHLDVVGEGSGWSTDPYHMVERDGMLYGRGVADDKGPLVAALFAMKAVKDMNLPLSKNVRLIMGTDEESGSEDIAHYYASHPFAPLTFSPDAEFPVINIEKGSYKPQFQKTWSAETALPRVTRLDGGFRINVVPPEAEALVMGLPLLAASPFVQPVAEETGAGFTLNADGEGIRIHCAGRNAHAASPEDGCNAITALLTLLARLPLADCESTGALHALHALFPHGDTSGAALGIAQKDEISGRLTLAFSLLTMDEGGIRGQFDSRVPLCADAANCKNVAVAAFEAQGFTAVGDMGEPHHTPADSPFVQTLLNCYEEYTGATNSQPISIGGGTYVHDIPGGVAYGAGQPGFDPNMHGADEHAPVADLLLAAKIFTQAIAELCS
ncbi:MAG: Sapep family Mn(2+)-dependent dipeptidase [Pseudoflavonifractor sp.]